MQSAVSGALVVGRRCDCLRQGFESFDGLSARLTLDVLGARAGLPRFEAPGSARYDPDGGSRKLSEISGTSGLSFLMSM